MRDISGMSGHQRKLMLNLVVMTVLFAPSSSVLFAKTKSKKLKTSYFRSICTLQKACVINGYMK